MADCQPGKKSAGISAYSKVLVPGQTCEDGTVTLARLMFSSKRAWLVTTAGNTTWQACPAPSQDSILRQLQV